MTISFPNMLLKNIDSIEVEDYGFELVADIDLEKEFVMEENSNEKLNSERKSPLTKADKKQAECLLLLQRLYSAFLVVLWLMLPMIHLQ